MSYGRNPKSVFLLQIEDKVRKASHQYEACIGLLITLSGLWVLPNALHGAFDCMQKVQAQASTLLIIPTDRGVEFCLSQSMKDSRLHEYFLRSRANTLSADSPES